MNATILLADDDPVNRAYSRMLIDEENTRLRAINGTIGYDLRCFPDGDQLVSHFRAERAAGRRAKVCILDWLMPGRDGIATAAALLAEEPQLPILLTSADPNFDYITAADKLPGNVFFLQKPIATAAMALLLRCLVRDVTWTEESPGGGAVGWPRTPSTLGGPRHE